jgi:hypothetical protein
MTVTNETMRQFYETWMLLFPEVPAPSGQQFAMWGLLHEEETVRKGLVQLATKYQGLNGEMTPVYMQKFLSSVMNRIARETKQPQQRKIAELPAPAWSP